MAVSRLEIMASTHARAGLFCRVSLTREVRASDAKAHVQSSFNDKQRAFLEFVLAQYVQQGVGELDQEKLTPLLRLKYKDAIADAILDLGSPEQIRTAFIGFQKHLYHRQSVSHAAR